MIPTGRAKEIVVYDFSVLSLFYQQLCGLLLPSRKKAAKTVLRIATQIIDNICINFREGSVEDNLIIKNCKTKRS